MKKFKLTILIIVILCILIIIGVKVKNSNSTNSNFNNDTQTISSAEESISAREVQDILQDYPEYLSTEEKNSLFDNWSKATEEEKIKFLRNY